MVELREAHQNSITTEQYLTGVYQALMLRSDVALQSVEDCTCLIYA